MRAFFLFCALLIFFSSAAQDSDQKKIDSLEHELKLAETDTSKVNIMNLMIDAYNGIDSLKSFQMGSKALEISKKIDYLKGLTNAYIELGGAYRDYSLFEEAQKHLEKGNELAQKLIAKDSSEQHLKTWIKGQYWLGLTYGDNGDFDTEFQFTEKVLPVAEAIGDSMFLANAHTNLGSRRLNLGQYGDAYRSLERGNAIYKALGNPPEAIFNRTSLTQALYFMDSIPRMKTVLDQVRNNLGKANNDFDRLNFHLQESMYYMGIKAYNKALASLDEAKAYVQGDKNSVQSSILLQRYAFIHGLKEDYDMAKTYMTKYFDAAQSRNDSVSMFQAIYKRSGYAAEDGDYKNAYLDYVQATDIFYLLEAQQTMDKYKELELKYSSAENEKAILKLENEKKIGELALEKRKSQTYLLGGIVSLLALLLFMGYIFYRNKLRKARKKERIQEAEVQLLKQEQQNKIFSAMIEGQEKERKRLAIDLHDGLGGRLSGISLNLSKLDKDEPKEYPKKQLRKVMKDLDDSLTELRTIARNMMPETLVKFGLQAALKDYCSSMTGKDTKVTLQFYGTEKGIDLNQQVTMYRVIQELINNAIKHAKATEVLVQYMREGNKVDITVEDNGVGFSNDAATTENGGMGLSNLRTRVAYLKGNLDFQTEENEGTTVNVHITIDSNAA